MQLHVARNFPQPFNKYCTNNTSLKIYYRNKGIILESFHLQTMTVHFSLSELKKLNIVKSTGLDSTPAWFLKDGTLVLASPGTHTINLSIMTNTVPEELKEAFVTPSIKKEID